MTILDQSEGDQNKLTVMKTRIYFKLQRKIGHTATSFSLRGDGPIERMSLLSVIVTYSYLVLRAL